MEKNGSSGEAQSGLQCGYSAGFLQTRRDLAQKQVIKHAKRYTARRSLENHMGLSEKRGTLRVHEDTIYSIHSDFHLKVLTVLRQKRAVALEHV